MMDEVNNLVAFKTISNFVKDLNTVMGEKKHNIALYSRLVEKTTISHEEPIRKHVAAFTGYCISNRDSILEKDVAKITSPRIEYSDKVYLDMVDIFEASDAETKEAIFQHLLAISAVVDPGSNAKKILREAIEKKGSSDNKEEVFLNKLITKVESAVDPEAIKDPLTAVTSILTNGSFREVFSELQSGIGNGTLDMGKMLGAMSGMMGGAGGMPDMGALMGMLGGGGGGTNPLAALMSGLAGPSQTPQNLIDNTPVPPPEKKNHRKQKKN